MRRTTLSLAALAFVAVAPAAYAQSGSAMSKVSIGVHAGAASVAFDEDEAGIKTKSGMNFGVALGYDVTPALRIGLGMDVAKLPLDTEGAEGDISLTHFDIGARYSLISSARRVTPFVMAAISARGVGSDIEGVGELTASGTGFTLGAGADYAFSPRTALTGSFGYTMGKFGDQELDGESIEGAEDVDGNGFRVNVGVSFRPFSGR